MSPNVKVKLNEQRELSIAWTDKFNLWRLQVVVVYLIIMIH
jgi:hypothetical protein